MSVKQTNSIKLLNLVKIVETAREGATINISPTDFTLVSTTGKDYTGFSSAAGLSPEYRTSLYEGASHSGWAAFLVDIEDPNPLLALHRSYDGSGGLGSKLQIDSFALNYHLKQ